MRSICLSMLVVTMCVIGCKSGSQNRGGGPSVDSRGGGSKGNFWDENPGPSTRNPSAPIDPRFGMPNPNESELDGVLAGRVVDAYDRAPGNAFIRVTLIDPKNPGAPPKEVGVTPNAEGYFVIQGLVPRKTYNLSAQSKEGDRVMAAEVQAQPPYTRLLIRVSENKVSSVQGKMPAPVGTDNPFSPPPQAKSPMEQPNPKVEPKLNLPMQPSPPEPDPIPMNGGSGANNDMNLRLDQPMRVNTQRDPADQSFSPGPRNPIPVESELPPSRTPASEIPINSIADGPSRQRDPRLSIPNPKSPPPRAEPPSRYQPNEEPQSMRSPPPPAENYGRLQPVNAIEPAPIRQASRSLNFTVYDPQGQPWEFQDNSGKLVLVDFWSTTCQPCIRAMPEMKRLTSRYGAAGLEVVGIATDDGPFQGRASKVAEIHRGKQLNYRVFLEGDRSQTSVQRMFGVKFVPTLILFTHEGKELWRGTGADHIPQLEAVLQHELMR